MQELEIFSRNWIFVSPSQRPIIIRVFQFLDPRRVSSKLLVKLSNRTRVLNSTMNQLFLAVALDLLNRVLEIVLGRFEKSDGEDGKKQQQEQQDVTLLVGTMLATKAHENHRIAVIESLDEEAVRGPPAPAGPDHPMGSALRQRNALAVVAEHVQYLDRIGGDTHNLISPVDNVSLFGDENVLILGQEHTLGASHRSCETIKHQIDGRRRRRNVLLGNRGLLGYYRRHRFGRRFHEYPKYIPSRSRVLRILARFQQIQAKRGVKRCLLGILLGFRGLGAMSRPPVGRRYRICGTSRNRRRRRGCTRGETEPTGKLPHPYPQGYTSQHNGRQQLLPVFCPDLHYAVLKYVSSFICSFTVPLCSPPKPRSLITKNN